MVCACVPPLVAFASIAGMHCFLPSWGGSQGAEFWYAIYDIRQGNWLKPIIHHHKSIQTFPSTSRLHIHPNLSNKYHVWKFSLLIFYSINFVKLSKNKTVQLCPLSVPETVKFELSCGIWIWIFLKMPVIIAGQWTKRLISLPADSMIHVVYTVTQGKYWHLGHIFSNYITLGHFT